MLAGFGHLAAFPWSAELPFGHPPTPAGTSGSGETKSELNLKDQSQVC